MTVEAIAKPVIKNPYIGPKPFEAAERHLFFGREWEAEELTALVIAHPAVLLYAQSGAGKSSLLNARVLIRLEGEEGCEVLPVVRVRGDLQSEPAPRSRDDIQLDQIKNIYIFNTLTSWGDKKGFASADLVNVSLADFLSRLSRPADEEGYPALRVLVFDQFEELFTFYPERWPEREQFFQQVNAALEADAFLRVLFVIREDYLAQLDTYAALLPEQLRSRFRLERLREKAALLAVEGPLKETHRSFAPGVAQTLVRELLMIRVENSAGKIVEKPGEFVEPVQLQVVCQALWTELPPEVMEITLEHLRTFGNVDQALTRFYERAIESTIRQMGDLFSLYREFEIRKSFDEEFITPAGTRGLVYQEKKKTGLIPNHAIKILDNQHVIRGERRAGAHWYELTHDRLIGPIQHANRSWRLRMLRKWGLLAGGFAIFVILTLFGVTTLRSWDAWLANQRATAAEATATKAVASAAMAQIEVTQAYDAVADANATSTVIAQEVAQVKETSTAQISEVHDAVAGANAVSTAAAQEVGEAQATVAAANATGTAIAQAVRKDRVRPLRAGLSIGGVNGATGTLGYFVVDSQGQIYILSSVEVLGTTIGEAILQPSSFDGGQRPADIIGRLAKLSPQEGNIRTAQSLAALALLAPGTEVEAAVPEIGPILGTQVPAVGITVSKVGRSTGLTRGVITEINQTVTIQVGDAPMRFQEAVLASLDASEGDEGALVVNEEGYAIGLVIASTGRQTVIAPIQPILTSFGVELLLPSQN